jgi:hypothetical protein
VVSTDTAIRTLPTDFDANKLRAMLTVNGVDGAQD